MTTVYVFLCGIMPIRVSEQGGRREDRVADLKLSESMLTVVVQYNKVLLLPRAGKRYCGEGEKTLFKPNLFS